MSERCLTKLFFLTFYSALPITGTVPTYKDFRSKLSMNSLFIRHTSVVKNFWFRNPQKGRAKILTRINCEWIFRDYFLTLFSTPGVDFFSHFLVVSQSGRKGRNEFCFAKPCPKNFLKYFLWQKKTLPARRTLKPGIPARKSVFAPFLAPTYYIRCAHPPYSIFQC